MARRIALALLLVSPSLASTAQAGATRQDCDPGQPGGVSTCFRVAGQVEDPARFDLAKLRDLPAVTESIDFFNGDQFTGALLWDLLQSVGVRTDPAIRNDILRKIVVVIGTDGYRVAFGLGELHPDFGHTNILVAYDRNGTPLQDDGFARIVIPHDGPRGGRFVSNIVKIEVLDPGPRERHRGGDSAD